MKNKKELEISINRITEMERIYVQVRNKMDAGIDLHEDITFKKMIQTLEDYYESGQWLKDYEADERGELPSDLKRGVLSQDGIYDLLCEIDQRGGIRNGK